jgi:hypothetical protein
MRRIQKRTPAMIRPWLRRKPDRSLPRCLGFVRGKPPPPGAITLFGIQHIKTGIGFVRGNGPGGPIGFVWGTPSAPGATTFFGTERIIMDQWVRLGNRFVGDLACFLDPFSRDSHWLRLVIRSLASFGETAASPIGFVWGNGPRPRCRRFRNPTYPNWYWLRSGKPFRCRLCGQILGDVSTRGSRVALVACPPVSGARGNTGGQATSATRRIGFVWGTASRPVQRRFSEPNAS